MTVQPLNKNRNLAAADQAAQCQFGHEDLSSPVAACPARQPEVFVVPARYAMAEQAAEHADFQPSSPPQSHPMGLRRLRAGYLYLWHADGPLARYAVAVDGLLVEQPLTQPHAAIVRGEKAGIALNKSTDAWMLYSEMPLSNDACERLKKSDERRIRMRQIGLVDVAKRLSARHCPPLEQASALVAELMPTVRDKALAHDYQHNGATYREDLKTLGNVVHDNPTQDNIKAFSALSQSLREREEAAGTQPPGETLVEPGVWSACPWEVDATQAWLDAAKRQAAALYAVFAALDDDLGVLRDINHEQESVEAGHEQWVGDNNLRLSVGGFVRSLVSEDGAELAGMARDANSLWSVLVNRLAAALLLLNTDKTFSSAWLGIFVTARLGSDTRVEELIKNGRPFWALLGQKAEGLTRWATATGRAIGAGHVAGITNSTFVTNSGGVVPLAALLLNALNAGNQLGQIGTLEGMGSQRKNDTVSASLYAGAALVAVIDSQVRKGLGINKFGKGKTMAPTLTLFGGVIGGLSAGAALAELQSLNIQLESAQTRADPWLEMRQTVVAGQVTAYGAQAILGFSQTARALAGLVEVNIAILRYTLFMGPLNWIIAVLGVLYLITWFFQQTPLQNFLNFCCWSKARAGNLGAIAAQAQQEELNQLYSILYTPRVSMESRSVMRPSNGYSGRTFVSSIEALTIDLPGAEPGSAYLELALIGDPVDSQAYSALFKNSPTYNFLPPTPWRDMAPHWLPSSTCVWIPAKEGQGLRLSGPFNTEPGVLDSKPRTISLRLRYRTPLTALLGTNSFIGGERGIAFTLSNNAGVIVLRDDPTPELDRTPFYQLGEGYPNAIYLQPEENP